MCFSDTSSNTAIASTSFIIKTATYFLVDFHFVELVGPTTIITLIVILFDLD